MVEDVYISCAMKFKPMLQNVLNGSNDAEEYDFIINYCDCNKAYMTFHEVTRTTILALLPGQKMVRAKKSTICRCLKNLRTLAGKSLCQIHCTEHFTCSTTMLSILDFSTHCECVKRIEPERTAPCNVAPNALSAETLPSTSFN